ESVLTREESDFAIKAWNVQMQGNFVDQIEGSRTGENILNITSLQQIPIDLKMTEAEFFAKAETVRQKLFAHRERRIHPHKDDKVLTDWNGLMIAALAKGARVFGRTDLAEAGARALRFFTEKMIAADNSLLHRFRDGEAAITGQLEDY